MENDKYIPGVCNIGQKEISRRRNAGNFGLVVFVALGLLLFLLHAARPFRLVLFIPAAVAAMGYLQAYMHFCAAFGSVGVFNFSSELGKTDTVVQAQFRAQDRRKAMQIILYSLIIGLIATLTIYYI